MTPMDVRPLGFVVGDRVEVLGVPLRVVRVTASLVEEDDPDIDALAGDYVLNVELAVDKEPPLDVYARRAEYREYARWYLAMDQLPDWLEAKVDELAKSGLSPVAGQLGRALAPYRRPWWQRL